jgi:hypothetical protein
MARVAGTRSKRGTCEPNTSVRIVEDRPRIRHDSGARYSRKEVEMPKYLVEANYVGQGVQGLLKEGGSSRRAVVEKLIKSLGGTMEAFY